MARYRPIDFMGKKDDEPAMVENWLERTERMLVQMHCTVEEKLECAVSLLQEEAYHWWVSVIRTAPSESVTWKFFLDEFKKQYAGRIYLNNMRLEFHNLKQRQMSVTEYQREFTRLSKYAPEILVSEEERCRKFEDGLNDHIRAHVIGFCHEDLSKIVTCALNIERVKKEENDRKERRQGKKNPSQVLISTRVRNSKDHRVLINLQSKLPVIRVFYRYRQLQVHKEVLLKDKLSFIVLIAEKSTRGSVGN